MITVVVPVSPIPSHPDTTIIDETIASVRHHLPDARIIIGFDGIRNEQHHLRDAYREHIRRTLWRADKTWRNTTPIIFEHHVHQIGVMRAALKTIDTPLVLFVEQDTPLTMDRVIDWKTCTNRITSGRAHLVRFAHENAIPTEHMHLMYDRDGDFVRTTQYSARPHLASTSWYLTVTRKFFTSNASCFLEDKLHSVCQVWPDDNQLYLYAPEPNNQRSYHLDGRAGGPKFDELQVF